jgi:hypothetical protein
MGMARVNFGAPYRLDPFFGEIGRQADVAITSNGRGAERLTPMAASGRWFVLF